MGSFYTIVRFCPDFIRDEIINVGLITFDEDLIIFKSCEDWNRVEVFANGDISIIKSYCNSLMTHFFQDKERYEEINKLKINYFQFVKHLNRFHSDDMIRFTPPRGSLDTPHELMKHLTEDLLY